MQNTVYAIRYTTYEKLYATFATTIDWRHPDLVASREVDQGFALALPECAVCSLPGKDVIERPTPPLAQLFAGWIYAAGLDHQGKTGRRPKTGWA